MLAVTRTKSDLGKAQTRAGYLFILPSAVLYAVFVLAPVIVTFILSFTYYDPMAGSHWVGLENFLRFFTGDRSLQIFGNTLGFALFAVAGNVVVGLLLALALNRAMPAYLLYLFRLTYFLPVIIAAAFVSIVWGYFYGDDLGSMRRFARSSRRTFAPRCATILIPAGSTPVRTRPVYWFALGPKAPRSRRLRCPIPRR